MGFLFVSLGGPCLVKESRAQNNASSPREDAVDGPCKLIQQHREGCGHNGMVSLLHSTITYAMGRYSACLDYSSDAGA